MLFIYIVDFITFAGRRNVKISGGNRKMAKKRILCEFGSSRTQIIVMEFEIADTSLECLYYHPIAL